MPGQPTLVIDGAHNGESARVLRLALSQLPHARLLLILGTSADKDVAAIGRELLPAADYVILTRSRHPRSLPAAELRTLLAEFTTAPIEETSDVPPALERVRALAGPSDLICVAGSLFVAAAAREAAGLPAPQDP